MFKNFAKYVLKICGVALTSYEELEFLKNNRKSAIDMKFLHALPRRFAPDVLDWLDDSKAQLRQDLFVLACLDFKRNGYFVEFGATDGVTLSNTYLLERSFGWRGILAEPARCWHEALGANRSVHIEKKCVWKESGDKLLFNEVSVAELSTINQFNEVDLHRKARGRGVHYEVESISLTDLLRQYDAPSIIDFLSIDTEGSEFDILKSFDFERYSFRVVACEHNHTPMRESVYNLLSQHGYRRVLESVSDFDDWYIGPDVKFQ